MHSHLLLYTQKLKRSPRVRATGACGAQAIIGEWVFTRVPGKKSDSEFRAYSVTFHPAWRPLDNFVSDPLLVDCLNCQRISVSSPFNYKPGGRVCLSKLN